MASAAGRKRAIDEENRKFNEAWTDEFLMIALPHNAGMSCLECADVIKTMKRNNAKLHFNAKHASTYAQLNAEAKQDRITALLNNRRRQQRMFTAAADANQKVALAGLKIVHAINKRGRLELHISSGFTANLIYLYDVASELLSNWSVGSKHSILMLANFYFR